MKYVVEMASGGMILHMVFYVEQFRHSINIASSFWEAAMLILLMKALMTHVIDIGSGGMIYLFMTIGSGI
jgi:hypothetical protein